VKNTAAILWFDLLGKTICKAAGHRWRMIPMGRHHPALTCLTCKDFRAPSRVGG
jgi:hypothetical protein